MKENEKIGNVFMYMGITVLVIGFVFGVINYKKVSLLEDFICATLLLVGVLVFELGARLLIAGQKTDKNRAAIKDYETGRFVA